MKSHKRKFYQSKLNVQAIDKKRAIYSLSIFFYYYLIFKIIIESVMPIWI
jgi:hypothetical protein